MPADLQQKEEGERKQKKILNTLGKRQNMRLKQDSGKEDIMSVEKDCFDYTIIYTSSMII